MAEFHAPNGTEKFHLTNESRISKKTCKDAVHLFAMIEVALANLRAKIAEAPTPPPNE